MINTQTFSIATLIYARLRRVTGRVIDAIFLSENEDYARHVIRLALATNDDELKRLVLTLEGMLSETSTTITSEIQTKKVSEKFDLESSSEPTEQDIYQHQVSHRYIGSLR